MVETYMQKNLKLHAIIKNENFLENKNISKNYIIINPIIVKFICFINKYIVFEDMIFFIDIIILQIMIS